MTKTFGELPMNKPFVSLESQAEACAMRKDREAEKEAILR